MIPSEFVEDYMSVADECRGLESILKNTNRELCRRMDVLGERIDPKGRLFDKYIAFKHGNRLVRGRKKYFAKLSRKSKEFSRLYREFIKNDARIAELRERPKKLLFEFSESEVVERIDELVRRADESYSSAVERWE